MNEKSQPQVQESTPNWSPRNGLDSNSKIGSPRQFLDRSLQEYDGRVNYTIAIISTPI